MKKRKKSLELLTIVSNLSVVGDNGFCLVQLGGRGEDVEGVGGGEKVAGPAPIVGLVPTGLLNVDMDRVAIVIQDSGHRGNWEVLLGTRTMS